MGNNSSAILNNGRIQYLDLARGIAVFFMIMQHAMIMHESSGGEGHTIIGNIFIALGTAPAAPVFIFFMGVFLVKSNKSLKENMMRGVKLFLLGYGLNLIRFTIPLVIAGWGKMLSPGLFGVVSGEPHGIMNYAIYLLFTVDIFQLAGLSLIFFSALKKYGDNKYIIPVLVLGILLLSTYLWGIYDSVILFMPLWGKSEIVDFPLFPWCIYFLLGMYLSKYFYTPTMERKVKKGFIIAGGLLALMGCITIGNFPIGDYYRSGFSVHILIISFLFFWLSMCDYIVKKMSRKGFDRFLNIIYFWSSNVTGIYVIQWILFGWSVLIIGSNRMPDYAAMAIGFLVVIMSHFIYGKTKHIQLKSLF